MDGQYFILKKVARARLLKSLMSNNDKTLLEVKIVERRNKKSICTLNLVVTTVTKTKHTKDIGFSGYIASTGRSFTATMHKKNVWGNFGMITFVLPNQPALTLVKGSKGGHKDSGK